jgi:hypothetical protein
MTIDITEPKASALDGIALHPITSEKYFADKPCIGVLHDIDESQLPSALEQDNHNELLERLASLEREKDEMMAEQYAIDREKRRRRKEVLKLVNPSINPNEVVYYAGKCGIVKDVVLAIREVKVGEWKHVTEQLLRNAGIQGATIPGIELPWEVKTEVFGRKGLIKTEYFANKADLIEFLTYED